MARRPIFVPSLEKDSFFEEITVEFDWHSGFSTSQKQKSIKSLHEAANNKNISNILEVSTKSDNILGSKLSAFNLSLQMEDGTQLFLESAFQGSKVFEEGGPFVDLYNLDPFEVKKDERISKDNKIIGFRYEGVDWDSEPKTAFYDWLYINALNDSIASNQKSTLKDIIDYGGFTDIEFNPEKSINCQARSCAVFVSLYKKGLLKRALESKEKFLQTLSVDKFYQTPFIHKQKSFFDEFEKD